MRNNEVIKHWIDGQPSDLNKALTTDGQSLYSYDLEIGHTRKWKDGRDIKVVKLLTGSECTCKVRKDHDRSQGCPCGRFYSTTTSIHVNEAVLELGKSEGINARTQRGEELVKPLAEGGNNDE